MAIFPRGESSTAPLREPIRQTDNLFARRFASDPAVTYLDIGFNFLAPDGTLPRTIMPDGTHPSDSGYEIWANAFAQAGVKP